MARVLNFVSCVKERINFGEYWDTNDQYRYIAVGTAAEVPNIVANTYATDVNLAGKVTGIGYGWQKYVVESNGKCTITIRGAAGGNNAYSGQTINPATGQFDASRFIRPGRGAKLQMTANFRKNQVLYLLVGCRGWCNYNFWDWGGGGGGASVILAVNPSGQYTFAPTGEKVDCVCVAGGGGGTYDSSSGNEAYYGKDANFNDGPSTNGGSSNSCGGGAGLTGNGSSAACGIAYNILSGTPHAGATSNFAADRRGGWGGGGSPYDGGGGGGGYSGGACPSNGWGGNGGTSYINPAYCTPVFRGYADPVSDATRRCVNPWSAYGHIEIELGRDVNKLILAEDAEGWKWFNGIDDTLGHTHPLAPNKWELLPASVSLPPDEAAFETYGRTIITNSQGLGESVRFYVCDKEEKGYLNIGGNVNGAIVKMSKDALISHVETIINSNVTANLLGTSVKFAVSKNKGASWLTFEAGEWVPIDITDKETFQNFGYDFGLATTIPAAKWNSLKAKTLRLAFCITQYDTSAANFQITQMKFLADLTGAWRHATDSQVEYEYPSNEQVKVTFRQAGSYKINYLDKNIHESEEETDEPVYLPGPGNVTLERAGSGKIAIKWKDPDDVVYAGSVAATWNKTIVIVNKDSYAANAEAEGIFRTEITTKNAHETAALEVPGLTNGIKYYVSIIPVNSEGVATRSNVNKGTIVPKAPSAITVTPASLLLDEDNPTGQFTVNYSGDGTLSITHDTVEGFTFNVAGNIVTVTATKTGSASIHATATEGPTSVKPANVDATATANVIAYLTSKSAGDSVKLDIDGVTVAGTIVQQGNPDSVIYDSSCDGTWVMMTDIYEERPWNENGACDDYSQSDVNTYLNNVIFSKFNAATKAHIKTVKLPYTVREDDSSFTDNTGSDGFETKVFLPSALELGFPTDVTDRYTFDGRKLEYFLLGNTTTERAKRVAEFEGEEKMYYTRSLYKPNSAMAYVVSATGSGTSYQGNNYFGIRFIIVLDNTTKINADGTLHLNS